MVFTHWYTSTIEEIMCPLGTLLKEDVNEEECSITRSCFDGGTCASFSWPECVYQNTGLDSGYSVIDHSCRARRIDAEIVDKSFCSEIRCAEYEFDADVSLDQQYSNHSRFVEWGCELQTVMEDSISLIAYSIFEERRRDGRYTTGVTEVSFKNDSLTVPSSLIGTFTLVANDSLYTDFKKLTDSTLYIPLKTIPQPGMSIHSVIPVITEKRGDDHCGSNGTEIASLTDVSMTLSDGNSVVMKTDESGYLHLPFNPDSIVSYSVSMELTRCDFMPVGCTQDSTSDYWCDDPTLPDVVDSGSDYTTTITVDSLVGPVLYFLGRNEAVY